ncbi:S-layer homology domain-containing protein [Clostridia bacterium]|nr:S-layer homology domain-containing protein [Clostridia bacterium]
MKQKLLIILLATLLVFSVSTMAYAENLVVEPINQELKEQMRTMLQDRIQIRDEAREQLQERIRLHDNDQPCFNDIEGHWAQEQIRSSFYWGLAGGFPDGSFSPNSPTTGTQSVLMVKQLLRSLDGISYDDQDLDEIDWDLVPIWARELMQEKTTMQIAQMSQNYGKANSSRLQFALLLAKSLKIDKMDFDEDKTYYLDQDEIPTSELGYVLALREMGLISGSNNRFYPNREITRAEVVVVLNRVIAQTEARERITQNEENKMQEEKPASG